jgi:SNF2 family DNA or RNA helicase
MIALHGIWTSPTFRLWGERLDLGAADAPWSDQAPSAQSASNGDHPAALSCAELHEAVGEMSADGLLASIAEESKLHLWLPCAGSVPVASNRRGTSGSIGPTRLRELSVPALAFSPAETIDLLVGLADDGAQRSGDSLRYWQALAMYAVSLLARRQFVPDIDELDQTTFAGRWRVFVNSRTELQWLGQLVSAMPYVCRAEVTSATKCCRPAEAVDSFIAQTTEALIFRSLSDDPFFEQIHDRAEREARWEIRWLSGLLDKNRHVRWTVEDSAATVGGIRSWISQLERENEERAAELCFTLVEPSDTDAPGQDTGNTAWRLRFDLRVPGSGEVLDIAQIWREDAEAPSILGQHLVNRRAHLRSELTRASTIFATIKEALNSPVPMGVDLDTNQAHAFIHEWGPLLQAEGFAADLPDWATAQNRRLGLELFVQPRDDGIARQELSLGGFGLSSMVDFDWRLAVGEDHISLEDFAALTSQGAPLVKVKGQWVDLDRTAASKALDFMRQRPGGRLTLVDAIRLAAGAEELQAGLPIVGLGGSSWVSRFLAQDSQLERLDPPPDFNGTLRPYQLRGLEWLAFLDRLGIGACLADDMGLGKTIQLIALLLHERRPNQTTMPGPTLLFVPMSVVGNWRREIERFAGHLRVLVHHGLNRLADAAFAKAACEHDVVITTYGLAHRDYKTFGRVRWHRIALDEAQRIKNPSANQTIAIRSMKAVHRVALTGTPLENHLSELWSIMEMLNPGLLGTAAAFRKRFAVPIEKMGDSQRANQLRTMLRPFLLRRQKDDPNVECDLPEKMEMRVFCNLTPEQAALYERTVQQMLGEVATATGIRRRGLILATLTKLKQICNHPAHFLRQTGPLTRRSGKCERIVEMLDEVLEEDDAALVFTQFKAMGDLLQVLFRKRLRMEVPFLHGSTSSKNRERMIQQFQEDKDSSPIFLLSLKAGGFGLNLTRANHVFHFDRWWNPAVERQATDRAHRIGQTRRVQVHKFVCIGTIEDRIDKLLTEKSALTDRIVGSGDEWLTGLSTSELKDYLTLSADAVTEP